MEYEANSISKHHPVRQLFHGVADRALSQSSLSDKDLLDYLTDLLIYFINVNTCMNSRIRTVTAWNTWLTCARG